jgi:hypothetical protein
MPRRVFPQPVKPSKINRIVTRQNSSRQHPYGVSTRSIAFVEPFATRGERMLCGVATFRSDLVRFVRLIRTYLHQTIPHLGSARQLLEPSIPLPGCLPTLPRQAEGAYLAYLAHFCNATGQHTEAYPLIRISRTLSPPHTEDGTCGCAASRAKMPSITVVVPMHA